MCVEKNREKKREAEEIIYSLSFHCLPLTLLSRKALFKTRIVTSFDDTINTSITRKIKQRLKNYLELVRSLFQIASVDSLPVRAEQTSVAQQTDFDLRIDHFQLSGKIDQTDKIDEEKIENDKKDLRMIKLKAKVKPEFWSHSWTRCKAEDRIE